VTPLPLLPRAQHSAAQAEPGVRSRSDAAPDLRLALDAEGVIRGFEQAETVATRADKAVGTSFFRLVPESDLLGVFRAVVAVTVSGRHAVPLRVHLPLHDGRWGAFAGTATRADEPAAPDAPPLTGPAPVAVIIDLHALEPTD